MCGATRCGKQVNAAGADEVIEALEEAGVLREVDDEEEYPRPRPPGAALAGQSGAARKTRCANCGKDNPSQLKGPLCPRSLRGTGPALACPERGRSARGR